jgi:alginate O-acetyltransferase complex protein AlgI
MWPEIRRPNVRNPRPAPHRQYVPEAPAATAPPRHWSGLYAGEPEACRRDVHHFLPVLAHLGLMLWVFRAFNVEGKAFFNLVILALAVLPVHYFAPFRWKKPLFVAASVAGLAWVFDATTTLTVLGLAAGLVGLCYLPVAWSVRAALVAAVAGLCAVTRSGAWLSALPGHVWPVLATMFMFRMIVYLYELKHAKKPEPLVDTLSYFFLLPNYCFPHFPVVNYRTMQRSHFARDIHATMRTGLQMMFRGTTHLLLYRLIYHELIIPADEVHNLSSLAGFLVCNYLLYLRVSGQFHMACGMLHLFGFGLPETHRHYLLASSFTDYWRRINIYWKDFMVRVVFNPVVFRLKRWPQPAALAVATGVVFLTTWALHAYQSFWLRGTWGFSVPDALFWGVLGLLVLVNVQLDARRAPARRGRTAAPATWRDRALLVAKTAATFTTITLLWSLWSSPSLTAWLAMLARGMKI